jgi:hypothetical protein
MANTMGQVVRRLHFQQTGKITIDFPEPKGVYLISVNTNQQTTVFKVVKK